MGKMENEIIFNVLGTRLATRYAKKGLPQGEIVNRTGILVPGYYLKGSKYLYDQ